MTRTQAFVALALLRKVLPDLASVEVSGNPDRPLTVQVVRFSEAEALEVEAKPLINLEQWSEAEALEPEET
jgi:hypothetical protein